MRLLLALALWSYVGCGRSESNRPPPGSGTPRPLPSTTAGLDAAGLDAASLDAASLDAAGPGDAAVVEAPRFGCRLSPGRELLACVVGQEGHGLIESARMTLVFVPLTEAARAPASIVVASPEAPPGDDPVDHQAAAAAAAATAGYTELPEGESIGLFPDESVKPSGSIEAGGLVITIGAGKPLDRGMLRTHVAVARGARVEKLDDSTKALFSLQVTAHELGAAVLITEDYLEAGEGIQGDVFKAWLCPRSAPTCRAIR